MAKYCTAIVNQIVANLRAAPGRINAVKGLISYETFTVWMRDHSEFSEAIIKAELEGYQRVKEYAEATIYKNMDKNWTCAAWWLERRHRETYALRQEITGSGGAPLQVTIIAPEKGILSANQPSPAV